MALKNCKITDITWASQHQNIMMREAKRKLINGKVSLHHWSRLYEYPWVMCHGDFQKRQWVLDAAGGDAPLQKVLAADGLEVINVDIEPRHSGMKGIQSIKGDLRKLDYLDDMFDRVLCVSVLEHIERPLEVIPELWRVLKPGGRLILTMDVASYYRWNHTVTMETAEVIVKMFGGSLPNTCSHILTMRLSEYKPEKHEHKFVNLRVMCLCCDKQKT